MNFLKEADYQLFKLINGNHDAVLDFLMYWISDKWIWIPLYIWLLYVLIKYLGKRVIYFAVLVALLIAATDQISVWVKFYFQRLRPCHDPVLADSLHLVNGYCGGQYGFFSSHASNTMALVVLMSVILPSRYKWLKIELLAYLLLVGYSRIYLGAHFPGDIVAGWIFGAAAALAGGFVWKMLNRKEVRK